MTWKDRLALGLCGQAGCPHPPWLDKNRCEPHWLAAKASTQRSTWRKRHSGVWRQEQMHVSVVVLSGGAVIHIAAPL